MKKITTYLLTMCMSATIAFAQLGTMNFTGGPDAYGYSWQTDSAGAAYNWIDITTTGTQITGLGDDGVAGPFNIGFNFPYYWTNATQFALGFNGYIALNGSYNIASGFPQAFPNIPTPNAQNNFVAALLCDLTFTDNLGGTVPGAKAFYYSNNADTLIVTYDSVAFYDGTAPGEHSGINTFQIIFSAVDSSITVNYAHQEGTYDGTYSTGAGFNPDHRCNIGLENVNGQVGLEVSNDFLPDSGTVVRFTLNVNPAYTVTDAEAAWNDNGDNGAFFALTGFPSSISTAVSNVGNQDITTPFDVNTFIQKSNSGAPFGPRQFDETQSITSLTVGSTSNITYTNQFTPELSGTPPTAYGTGSYWVVTDSKLNDDNVLNDRVNTEMVVLDTANMSDLILGYDDGEAEGLMGFDGAGVYFEPPVYPVLLKEIRFQLLTNDGNNPTVGFEAKVFDDDGTNGGPQTLLFSQTVLTQDVIAETALPTTGLTHDITIITPDTITSGGFYVGLEKTGNGNVFVAVDQIPPLSNRGYEVIGGVWGGYRSSDTEDIMIYAVIDASIASTGVSVADKVNVTLGSAYPNPTTGVTSIDLNLGKSANVQLNISNVIGQNVSTMNFGKLSAGNNQLNFDVSAYESGIYFYSVVVNDEVYTNKLIVK